VGIQTALNTFAPVVIFLTMAAISLFFINIFRKYWYAKAPDDRRRLKLLYGGATVALTPLFFLIFAAIILRRNFNANTWFVYPILLLLFVFPLTLAYVIVVEKAMELRVAIRQGLQYAMARRGLRMLTGAVIVGLIFFAVRLINEPGARKPQQITVLGIL